MNYNPAALTTCTLEKEETYSEICVELTTTSDEHQLTHYWALLECSSVLWQIRSLSIVPRYADRLYTHTDEPTQSVLLAIYA